MIVNKSVIALFARIYYWIVAGVVGGASRKRVDFAGGSVRIAGRSAAGLGSNRVTNFAQNDIAVNGMMKPMQVGKDSPPYGGKPP